MATEDRRSTGDALLGRTIAGKYTIESRVGGGGMGSVYRARQAGLDKIVAVKILHRELLAEPTFATRFKREATSASRIDHPSSMRVLDFGEEPDGILYIAMEFLEGRTLFKVLREEAPLAPSRIVDLSRQILAALAAAHELGIVHRDLKPENVIVLPAKDDDGGASEHVKVCDFGIAKLQTDGDAAEKLTMEGSIVGTPEYLSPEQARGGDLDARSDLYSMGVILFEMLTGAPPFRGDSPLAIVLKHLDTPPPRPSSMTPTVDLKLEAVCLKALSKSPGDRYSSAREMRAALTTDTPDALAPPATSRASSLLVMTETPPPVSSTQVPVPLTMKRPGHGSGQRPRLSEISEPAPTGSSRVLMAVVGVALLAGGAGAYWFQRQGSVRPPTAAQDGPTVAPSTGVTASPPPTDQAAAPDTAPVESSLPASENPTAVASAGVHHHHGTKGPAPATSAASKETAAASSEPATPFPDDLHPSPAAVAPTASPVKVRFSNIRVTGIAATNVTAALPVSRFASCYRGGAGSQASVSVHLDLTRSMTTARCGISDQSLADLGACLVDATKRVVVTGVPAGGASADVDINFDAP